MKNANLLLSIGEKLYNKMKNLVFYSLGGLCALALTLLFCGKYAPLYLALSGHYAIVNIWVGMLYLMIAIGLCAVILYFMGLVLIGLGQIAKNTDPSNRAASVAYDDLPDL